MKFILRTTPNIRKPTKRYHLKWPNKPCPSTEYLKLTLPNIYMIVRKYLHDRKYGCWVSILALSCMSHSLTLAFVMNLLLLLLDWRKFRCSCVQLEMYLFSSVGMSSWEWGLQKVVRLTPLLPSNYHMLYMPFIVFLRRTN